MYAPTVAYRPAGQHRGKQQPNLVLRWTLAAIAAMFGLFTASVAVGYHLADESIATGQPPTGLIKAVAVAVVAVIVAARAG